MAKHDLIDTHSGPSRIEHHAMESHYLPGSRLLRVYLPSAYACLPERTFPVLYLQDGQKLFGAADQSWQLQQTLDQEIAARRIEPLIVVGIDVGEGSANPSHPRRIAEYTPIRDAQLGGGDADRYGRMLVQEIQPAIAARYRIRSGRESTGIGGSSLGALVSLYLALEYPRLFGQVAALSPSVWWHGEFILKYVARRVREFPQRPRIWLDVGDSEGERSDRDTERLRTTLAGCGWRAGSSLHSQVMEHAGHDEAAWGGRMGQVLRFLFPAAKV